MRTVIGPHLLGRVPNDPDHRDYSMAEALAKLDQLTPLEKALKNLKNSHIVPGVVKTWAELATHAIEANVPSPPTPPDPNPNPPTPPVGAVIWENKIVLDQGNTPHCVGFGWADWGNNTPIEDNYTNTDGNNIYYEAKVIDGEPKQENGSQVRSGAKAMQNRKKLTTYVFASTVDEMIQWVQQHGPVVIGSDWTNDMFSPDSNGFIVPTGPVEGGHCYDLVGYDGVDTLIFQNSWGTGWALNGRFKMKVADFATLWGNQGDGCAALEI